MYSYFGPKYVVLYFFSLVFWKSSILVTLHVFDKVIRSHQNYVTSFRAKIHGFTVQVEFKFLTLFALTFYKLVI